MSVGETSYDRINDYASVKISLARPHDTRQQVVQHGFPDLTPRFTAGMAERMRMLGAEDRAIGVVVKDDELRAPKQDDLSLRRKQHAQHAAQALGPRLHRTERRLRPVECAHERTQLSAAGQDRCC